MEERLDLNEPPPEDDDQFQKYVKAILVCIERSLRNRGVQWADVEDAAQEAIITAWLKRMKDGSWDFIERNPVAYLSTVGFRKFLDRCKSIDRDDKRRKKYNEMSENGADCSHMSRRAFSVELASLVGDVQVFARNLAARRPTFLSRCEHRDIVSSIKGLSIRKIVEKEFDNNPEKLASRKRVVKDRIESAQAKLLKEVSNGWMPPQLKLAAQSQSQEDSSSKKRSEGNGPQGRPSSGEDSAP